MAARGWAWTAYDWDEGRLFNYIGDAQNTYPVWNATPLVALDVYEHAYFLDFQTDRAAYIDAFFANLDWSVVNGWIDDATSSRPPEGPVLENALIVAGGYLIGSIPFGVVLVRVFRGEDIRRQGSGNIGASNVWRAYGRRLGVPVALLDVAKGFVPALLGLKLGGEWVGVLAGGGGDARSCPAHLARVHEGRQDGRDGGWGCARARPARRGDLRRRLARDVPALPLRLPRLARDGGRRCRSCAWSSGSRGRPCSSRRRRARPYSRCTARTSAGSSTARSRASRGELAGCPATFDRNCSLRHPHYACVSQSASVVWRPPAPVISARSSPTVPQRSARTS